MKKFFAAIAMSLGLAATPASGSTLDQSCAFVRALESGGAESGVEHLMHMARDWKPEDAAKMKPLIGPVLARFDYASGDIYAIAALGESLHEHLVVMQLKTGGSVYMRLLYEGNGGELTFINIDFQAKFHDILQKPVLQEPVRLSCN